MANVLAFGNKQWHNAVPNNTKVAIPFDMEKEELTKLREKLDNAGMNYYGYIVQKQEESVVKISISQKELDDFCRISGIENPIVEKLNSNPADEENKKKKNPVGNVSYRYLNSSCRVNCDVETALLAENRMERQGRPVSMKIWSFDGDKASISTDSNSYQVLKDIIEQIEKSKEARPKEMEKAEVQTPAPAPKPTVVYSEMGEEEVRKLAEIMMKNVCPSARNDLQKLAMFGEPPEINSPFFDNKTVIDFRKGIDVSEKMGKDLFDKQTGSFFSTNGIHISSVGEDSFVIAENGKNYDISYSRLGVAVEENLKEDFANDKRFQGFSHISEKDMEDVQLLYNAYKTYRENTADTSNSSIPKDKQKHGIAIAERFLLANETGLNIETDLDKVTEENKIALALALSHIGVREKFTDYSLDVDYKKTLPQNVVEDIVKNANEYKELILNSEAGKEINEAFKDGISDEFSEIKKKAYEANDVVCEYADYYLKITQQLQTELANQNFQNSQEKTEVVEAINAFALAYALADAGEVELKEERIIEKAEKEIPQEQEEESPEPEKADVAEQEEEKEKEPKKTAPRRKKEEITDFGKYIGGAKKENFSSFAIKKEWSDEERKSNIKKSNIWQFGKKEQTAMRDSGVPVEMVYYIAKIRDSIANRPNNSTEAEQKRYVDFVNSMKEICENAVKGVTFDDVSKMRKCIDEIQANADNLTTANAVAISQRTGKLIYSINNLGYATRNFLYALKSDKELTEKVQKSGFLATPEQKFELDVDKRFAIIKDGDDNFFVFDRKTSKREDNFSTYEEARQHCRETIKDERKERKSALVPPQLKHIERTGGEQYREEGNKITGNDVMENFRLFGGEFGNWENQQLRQSNLDMLYDSLKDLAKVLNVKSTDIGLNGSLAIAFGARGRGNALAHYESQKHVINLTRERGAGSLAHEFAHALDRYINESLSLTHKTFASEDSRSQDNPLTAVMNAIKFKTDEDGKTVHTDFFKNANQLSGNYSKTGNGYWNAPTEMFARAFACYVTDKLAEMGMKNDYLSGHSDFSPLTAPQGEERKNINQAIDKMIEQIKEMGLMQEPVTERVKNLYIYTRRNFEEKEFVPLPTYLNKTDECILDGKNYLVMQSENEDNGKLYLVDKDGVVYDDNISVNYSQYDSLDSLIRDSICTNTAKALATETGLSEKETLPALKKLYEEGTFDFDDMHCYCFDVECKHSGDEIDKQYVDNGLIADISSAVADILNEKEEVLEAETPSAPDLD